MGPARSEITGGILAGGAGRRLGGADKGRQRFRGRPLVEHVLERLAPQVSSVLISANRNLAAYRGLGYPVVADAEPCYAGPLAGVIALLRACRTPYLLIVPCDDPWLPRRLAARLAAAIGDAEAAIAHDGERAQPLYALLRQDALRPLEHFFSGGGRAVWEWLAGRAPVTVGFHDHRFVNLNRPDDLARLEDR